MAKPHTLSFHEAVWKATKRIPRGKVATYGIIVRLVGKPKAARAVGNALNKNPYAPIVPCHRVVRSDGSIGGFASGSRKKAALLAKEGVSLRAGKVSPFEKFMYTGK